jgi:translocation and assembly module TamB
MKNSIGEPQRQKKTKRILYLLFLTIFIGLLIFISRGPYVSNALKRLILPELEAALQQKVIAKKIYINIFPFFIEAKDLKVFDEDGKKILLVKRVKGYIEPLGFLSKHISIRRLVIKEPNLSSDRKHLDDIIKNVRAYLDKETKLPFKVRVKVVEVSEGSASLHDEDLGTLLNAEGLGGEVILGNDPRLTLSIKKYDIRKSGLPELTGNVTTSLVFKKNEIEIKQLTIGSYGSELKGAGFYSNSKGTLKTDIALLVNSVKNVFNLKQRGEGKISAEGEIRLEGLQSQDLGLGQWKNIFVDLKLRGDFYIQTLMEILKVKEKIEGLIDFQGEIKGKLSDISGKAKARLRKGNLFGVEIDSVRCDVSYQDGLMRFYHGNAELYSGNAKAEASITLPYVEPFTLNIQFDSINSRDAFKLIGWEPGIPAGKVEGELMTSGSRFNPDGWFVYQAQSREPRAKVKDHKPSAENALDRIRNIKSNYSMRSKILSLSGLQLRTSLSDLKAEGTIDITKKTLDFACQLITKEVSDLILPYYSGLKGQGTFSGRIKGTFDNPEISGRADISSAFVEAYRAYRIASNFTYNKRLLSIQELLVMPPGEEHRLKGKILFPEAEKLFDVSKPVYEMNATVKNADLRGIIQLFSKDIPATPVTGRMNADFKIGGKDKNIEIAGNANIIKPIIYKIPFDSASIAFSYLNKGLAFKKVMIKQGVSTLTAEGKISSDKRFSFRVSSEKILIKNLGLENVPEGAFFSVQSEGQGTFKDPNIVLNAKVIGGVFKGRTIGNSTINGEIKNKNIFLKASLFDERIKLRGEGHLDDRLPWNAEIVIQPGRYDFILASIFRDLPEDLLLNLKGHVEIDGDIKNIRASADISNLTFSLLGYSFSNDSDIKVQIDNRKLSFPAFAVRGGGTSLVRVSGSIDLGREYDLHLEGKSSLLPLKALFKRVEHLTGDTDFAFSITGKWENPGIKGDFKISNASIGLKSNYPRITSINGYAYIDEDKFIVKKLSGKIGGGEINVSGLLHLKGFRITRFHFESDLDNISTALSRDFNINFKGNLVYKGTPEAQDISGDIKIKSARYKEKIDWKSLILKTKAQERPKGLLSGFEETALNISISGSDNISIDNNVVRAPVRVNIIVRGKISQPVLFGRLESKEGVFYFRNNEFKIIHASADFADPKRLNPFIELMAETSVKGYHIKLNIEGQMEHFNLSLSSDPPLEEMDVFALLTVGKEGKELQQSLGGGISSREATSFLAGELEGIFEERLKTITGFDRLQVGPYVSKITGTVEPRVTVSKRLLGDRLYVTYSTTMGSAATEEQILKLEYLLDRNISLIGSRDERGIVGGDIKFRFEFK